MMRRSISLFLIAALLVVAAACKNNNADENAEKDQEGASAVATDKGDGESKEGDDASTPATDRYPKIPFGKLSAEQRATFVDVAKAELCPCEGSTVSLDACLQDPSKQCSTAIGAAATAMQAIQGGLNKTDTLARIAEYIEASNKTYEFDLEVSPWKGAEEDPGVVIVEFADFECPFCKRASDALAEVMETYGDKGVRLYYKHFPLPMHKNAEMAARASVAAHMQDKFWPMHDLIFKNQRSLSPDKIDSLARQLGLNFQKFKKDMDSAEARERVASDRKEGEMAQVSGTPAIFINGKRYLGAPDNAADLERAVQEALAASAEGGEEKGAE